MAKAVFGYPRTLPYAVGRFDSHHIAPLLEANHSEPSPLGHAREYLRANKRDLNGALERLSDNDRFGHDSYFLATQAPSLSDVACPYCGEPTLCEIRELTNDGQFVKFPIPESMPRSKAAIIFNCDACGWWRLIIHFKEGICNDWDHILWYTNFIYDGVIFDFPIGQTGLVNELRMALRKRAIDLRNVSPTDLERVVGSVFRDHLGVPVRHVGGPGDGGIDLIVSEADDPIAIQVKRRSRPGSVESVAEVRHLLGSMILGGFNRGLFVTTADHFSEDARRAAEQGRRHSVFIELYDHGRLSDLIQRTPPLSSPWERILTLVEPNEHLREEDATDERGSIFMANDSRVARHPRLARWLEKTLRWLT